VLSLARQIAGLWPDATYPGDRGEWSSRRKDLEAHAEIAAVRDNGARMVALGGHDARGTFDQLEVVMCQWRAIRVSLDESGPFIYVATRTTFRPICLGP
jgi:hypothetical protein